MILLLKIIKKIEIIMNKIPETTIDPNFLPKNTPDNKRGIPNDLSEILP